MKRRLFPIISVFFILFLILSCKPTTAPNIDNIHGLFILEVTKDEVPASNALVYLVNNEREIKDTLRTDSNGLLIYDPIDKQLPELIFVKEEGFRLGYHKQPSESNDTLRINLQSVVTKYFRVTYKQFNMIIAFKVDVIVDGFTIEKLNSGEDIRAYFNFGLPEGVETEFRLISPPIEPLSFKESNQSYTFNLGNIDGYQRVRLIPILSNSPIPRGTYVRLNDNSSVEVNPDGFAYVPGEEHHTNLTIEGENFQSYTYNLDQSEKYLSYFENIVPFVESSENYQPLFDITLNDVWEFDGYKLFGRPGASAALSYDMTWTFTDIQTTSTGIEYTIEELVSGTRSSSFNQTKFEYSNTVRINETFMGIWSYVESSEYSPPLHSNYWGPDDPDPFQWQVVDVIRKDGSTYKTIYGKPTRMAPSDVSSYTYTFNDENAYSFDENGLVFSKFRAPSSNSFSIMTVTRK